MDSFNISDQEYKQIEKAISSEESVVGIDAKKTHIIILHLLKKWKNDSILLNPGLMTSVSKS